jgi:hypothetical protein
MDENGKGKTEKINQYATWNVKEMAQKGEELDNVLNEKHIKIAEVTQSEMKLKATMETYNCILIHSGVNRKARTEASVMFWVQK